MTVLAERIATRTPRQVLVSAPGLKFTIGMVASICAVLAPRLIAALTITDRASVTFVSRQYFLLALIFSGLVGLVVAILEWRVPRVPRDTFMTTLGLPAILAGALSANQNTAALQHAAQTQDALADALSRHIGISIEPAKPVSVPETPEKQGALIDLLVAPVYAQGTQANVAPAGALAAQRARLGILIDQARYLIVLDRARTEQDAQTRAFQMGERLKQAAPGRPLNVQIEKQASEFLIVVSGGPRLKSDAVLEAVRVKDTYHVTPTLVEVQSKS
jgi:hypothetical protein